MGIDDERARVNGLGRKFAEWANKNEIESEVIEDEVLKRSLIRRKPVVVRMEFGWRIGSVSCSDAGCQDSAHPVTINDDSGIVTWHSGHNSASLRYDAFKRELDRYIAKYRLTFP